MYDTKSAFTDKEYLVAALIISVSLTSCARVEKFDMTYLDGDIIRAAIVEYEYGANIDDYTLLNELSPEEASGLISELSDIEFAAIDGQPHAYDGIAALIYFEDRTVFIIPMLVGVFYQGETTTPYQRDIYDNDAIRNMLLKYSSGKMTDEGEISSSNK